MEVWMGGVNPGVEDSNCSGICGVDRTKDRVPADLRQGPLAAIEGVGGYPLHPARFIDLGAFDLWISLVLLEDGRHIGRGNLDDVQSECENRCRLDAPVAGDDGPLFCRGQATDQLDEQ